MEVLKQALTGVTVIERAEGVAAQYCGRLLALLGARVIKVEQPDGCALRAEPPLICQSPPRSALFEYLNVGKLAVTCDLAQSSGRSSFASLLDKADIIIDDTPLSERGEFLEPQGVCKRHPQLIYVSILPFGATGNHATLAASELIMQHAGGEGYLMPNGLALELFPDRPPVKIYGHFAETIGGTSAVCAILGALLVQPDVGGQFVDISVQDANVVLSCFAIQRLGDGFLETRHGRSFRYGGVLECVDGFVQLLVLEQHQWLGLVELMGHPAWAAQPEYVDPMERGQRGKDINVEIRAWARTQKVADVVSRGQALSVPLTHYRNTGDILANEKNAERPSFANVSMGALGSFPVFVAPFRFGADPLSLGPAIGAPGADNDSVLGEILLENTQGSRVIRSDQPSPR